MKWVPLTQDEGTNVIFINAEWISTVAPNIDGGGTNLGIGTNGSVDVDQAVDRVMELITQP